MEGIILSGVGGQYTVLDASGRRYKLRAQAKLRRQRLTPLVGDRVRFEPGEAGQNGWLEEIMPRRTSLIRPAVANVDVICLTLSAGTPEPDLMLIDRLMIKCRLSGIGALIVVNKCDLGGAAEDIAAQYRLSGAEVLSVSAATGLGLDALRDRLRGQIFAMAGQSGVGKSSLLNALYGLSQETGALSQKIERGRNTTRHAVLTPVEGGGMALDTPGFSLFELELMDPREMPALVPEFGPYEGQCRFSPCFHRAEPGCAVIGAVRRGELHEERWARYCEILDDMRIKWRERYD